MNTFTVTSASGIAWNGPICVTCGAWYTGHHACSQDDILRRVRELLALLPGTPQVSCRPSPADRMAHCPCRRENGGSGVCGCVLSGPQVTC